MRFVNHDEDFGRGVEDGEGGCFGTLLQRDVFLFVFAVLFLFTKFMHQCQNHVAGIVLNMFLQSVNTAHHMDLIFYRLGAFEHLRLQIPSVNQQDNLIITEIEGVIHLADDEHHGECFARALSMPKSASFFPGQGGTKSLDDFACTSILHIAGDKFHPQSVVLVLEGNVVLHDVKKVRRLQHSRYGHFL